MSSVSADDTIVAIATPPGRGGVGVVRLSGPDAGRIAEAIAGSLPTPRIASLRTFHDAEGPIDEGLVVVFPAPRSYTGQTVVEFHGHGSPVALDLLVQRALILGARMAEPGEFTQRAYLNDRLDLATAESVADLIDASSAAAVRAAQRSLTGEFSRRVSAIQIALEHLRIEVEASIDFADEDIELQESAGIRRRLAETAIELADLRAKAAEGRLLTEGLVVALAGRPNAGKSSLLNALTGHDAAIVTAVPGTTRDVLRERVNLGGVPVWLYDTAGLRATEDPVEVEGIQRAKRAIADADHVLYLIDSTDPLACAAADAEIAALNTEAVTAVYTKADLSPVTAVEATLRISTLDRQSLDRLRDTLVRILSVDTVSAGAFSARRRHLDALSNTERYLNAARACADHADTDLLAEELRAAHQALGVITGAVSSEDLLGRIFSTFCIGK